MTVNRTIDVGTSGWSYLDWKGVLYPPGLPSKNWLEFYAGRFPTVEINMTFYRLPTPAMLEGWSAKTPPGFRFTLKAFRLITHLKKLRQVEGDVRDFTELADRLGDKLGCILFQLPPSLAPDVGLLAEFLGILSAGHRNVIEFRHPGWYDERVFELMRRHGVALCIVPSGRVPSTPVETSDVAYIRFHGPDGHYASSYADTELGEWAGTIKRLRAAECFVYFNNDARGYAVLNALRLTKMLGPAARGAEP